MNKLQLLMRTMIDWILCQSCAGSHSCCKLQSVQSCQKTLQLWLVHPFYLPQVVPEPRVCAHACMCVHVCDTVPISSYLWLSPYTTIVSVFTLTSCEFLHLNIIILNRNVLAYDKSVRLEV